MTPSGPFVDLRRDIAVIRDSEAEILRLDLEARLILYTRDAVSFRRGFDGRVRRQARIGRMGEAARDLGWLDDREVTELFRQTGALIARARSGIETGEFSILRDTPRAEVLGFLDEAGRRGGAFHAEDAGRFHALYRSVPILPPDQYRALYLTIATGCSYNLCDFCTLYRDRAFSVPGAEEWAEHLRRTRDFLGRGLSARHGIFLGDGNGLAVPDETLIARLETARRIFPADGRHPDLGGIAAFHDTFSGRERGAADYARLREFGLERLYIGVESGHDPLRRRLRKPGSAQDVAGRISTVKAGGLSVGLMILLGVAEPERLDAHISDTIRLVRSCRLGREDRVFLSVYRPDGGSAEEVGEPDAERARFREALAGEATLIDYDYSGFVY